MMDDDLRQDPPRSGEVWRVDFGPPDGHLAALVHCTPYEMDPGVVTSRLSPNLIGVYEVAFEVPSGSGATAGNDVVLSVSVNANGDSQTRFSNGSKLPIQ